MAQLKERYSKSFVQQRLKIRQELNLETCTRKKPGFSSYIRNRTSCYDFTDSSSSCNFSVPPFGI